MAILAAEKHQELAAKQHFTRVCGLFDNTMVHDNYLVGKRNREKVTFNTETATIGIRGTHFGALLCQNDCGGVPTTTGKAPANGLHVDVTSGAVVMTNKAGSVQLNAGQFGFAANANGDHDATHRPRAGAVAVVARRVRDDAAQSHQ